MKQAQRVKIFCSYAHEDQLFAHQLKTHFASLERLYPWALWTDTEIRAGEEWEQTIQKHLDAAQIILLLVSPDFMASDYCYSKEMKRAMERHEQKEACVIPIIIRPVAYWKKAPFGKLQALPADGKPITDRYWHTTDDALSYVVEKISQALGMHSGENKVSTTSIVAHSLPSHPAAPNASSHLQAASDTSLILVDQKPTKPAPTQAESRQPYTIASSMPGSQPPSLSLALDGSVQIERAGAKIFAYQEAAYQFLMNIIDRYGVKEAVLLQYSCQTSLHVLRMLLRMRAEVTLFIQHEDTPAKLGSQFQAERIRNTTRNLRSDLGDTLLEPDKLKIYKYRAPSSMSAIKIDSRVLFIGWYTYEQKEHGCHRAYPDDTIELSGHDRAAVVAWKGINEHQKLDETFSRSEETNEFEALDKTFSVVEKNYREHGEVVLI